MPEALDKVTEKVDQMSRAFEEFKKANDQRIQEIKDKKTADPLVEEKVNKANTDIDKLMADKDRLQKEIDEVKTVLNRKGGSSQETEKDLEKVEKKQAFLKFVRGGERNMTDAEMKKLSVSSDPDGGYLVDTEVEAEIIRNLANINLIRSIATVRTISRTDALERRRRTAGVTATWAGETSTNPSKQNPKFGRLRIQAEEMRVMLDESAQILEDAATDVEGWLNDEAAEAFANSEGLAFVNGDGSHKPRGMLSYTAGTGDGQVEQVVSGSAGTIADTDGQANGLIGMVYGLKAAYAKNGKFLINRKTTGSVRKLKDSNKNYIWQPGMATAPPTILGYEYVEDDNMPIEGANNLVVVFADFKLFYKIVDRLGTSVIRDPFTAKPDVEFLFRRRVGGGVEIFEAGKILKCST